MNQHRIILGIDPGLQHTGWGVIAQDGQKLRFIAAGTISTNSKAGLPSRLLELSHGVKDVLNSYTIDEAAMEETFLNKNPLSSLKLGHARGALLTTLMQHEVMVEEYASTQVKKTVVGVGRAEKEQVQHMVQLLLPKARWNSADAADALAVAITHAHHVPTLS